MTQDPNTPGIPPESGPTSTPPDAPIDYGVAGGGYAGPPPSKEEQTLGLLVHLLGIIGFLGPLIIWLIKKDQSPFINDQGKEALNFHLTMLIGIVAGILTACIGVGLVILPAVWVLSVVFSIIGGMKANQGIAYRYPVTIRFIK
ncbi:MAG: hypothetical protein JWO87_3769 [Phycisphaerales bacterium]|nr:hypothetical protein [Phycisphaerales bacterium]